MKEKSRPAMAHILGQAKQYKDSKWTTLIKPASIYINAQLVFPELQVCEADPSSDSEPVIHLYTMMDLTDCGSNETFQKIFLTFKEEDNGADVYTTVECSKLLARDGSEAPVDKKINLFKSILASATHIKADLTKPYVSSLPAPYGLPQSYDFAKEYSAISVFLGRDEGRNRIGEYAVLALASGSALEEKGLKFGTGRVPSAYLSAHWLVVDVGESGTTAIPILPDLIFEILADEQQFSIALPYTALSQQATKAKFLPLAFVFSEGAEFQEFSENFAKHFSLAARKEAGYKIDAKDAQDDNQFVSTAFCPQRKPRKSSKSVPIVEANSDSNDCSDVESMDGQAGGNGIMKTPLEKVEPGKMEAGYLDPKLLNYKDPAHSSVLLKNHLVAQFLFQGSTAVVSRDDALELCHVQPKLRTESLQLRDKFGSILAPGALRFGTNVECLLSTSLSCPEDQRDIIYRKDFQRPDTLQYYTATDTGIDYHPEIVDFDTGKAGASSVGACSIDPSNAIVVLTKMGVHMLDTRIAGSSQRSGVSYSYKSSVRFSAILVTPKGHVVTGSMAGEIRVFNKMGQRALTCYPGIGYPITHLAITGDEKWLLATAQTILLVYPTTTADGEHSCFSGHGIPGDKRPKPIILRLSPETAQEIGATTESGLRPATFSLDEAEIITGTEKYLIIWNFDKVKAGVVSSSRACTKIALGSQLIGAGMGVLGQIAVGTDSDFRIVKHARRTRKR